MTLVNSQGYDPCIDQSDKVRESREALDVLYGVDVARDRAQPFT